MAVINSTGQASDLSTPAWLSWLISITPLIALPFMVSIRNMDFLLPNEEPKWGVLLLAGTLTALAGLWAISRASRFSLHLPAIMLLLFFGILGLGVFLSPDLMVAISRFSYWFACLMIWLAAVYAVRYNTRWLGWLGWAAALSGLLFSLLYLKGYLLDYGTPAYNISVLFSPIGHVNYTSDALIMLLPMLLWILTSERSVILRAISWVAAVTCGSVILIAASRGAMAGLIFGAVIAALLSIRHISLHAIRSNVVAICLLISALAGSFILYSNMPYHFRDAARLSNTFEGAGPKAEEWTGLDQKVKARRATEAKNTNPETADKEAETGHTAAKRGEEEKNLLPPLADMWAALAPELGRRTPLYAATLAMILDKPMLGHGTGSFADIYPAYANKFPDFHDPHSSNDSIVDNPHNTLLQIAAENGLPATFLFLVLLFIFSKRLLLRSIRQADWLISAGVVAMSAAILDAMFNQIFFSPASMFLFALLGGTLWGRLQSYKPVIKTFSLTGHHISGGRIFLTVAIIVLMLFPARWIISEWYAGQGEKLGNRMPLTTKQFYENALAYNQGNYIALYNSIKRDVTDKEMLTAVRKAQYLIKVHPFDAASYNLLGTIHLDLGNMERADLAFQQALQIYPDFRLARFNLYNLRRMPKH